MSSSNVADLLVQALKQVGVERIFGVVGDPADLAGAMREAFAHPGPALLDVVPARQELSMPPKIGVEQATGFGLRVAKAGLDAHGDEVVDLARTNLLR